MRDLCFDPYFVGVVPAPLGALCILHDGTQPTRGQPLLPIVPPASGVRLFD